MSPEVSLLLFRLTYTHDRFDLLFSYHLDLLRQKMIPQTE